jgi:hypothetical protein
MVNVLYVAMVCLSMAAMTVLVGVVEAIKQKTVHAKRKA